MTRLCEEILYLLEKATKIMVQISTFEKECDLHNPRRVMKYVLLYCSERKIRVRIDEHDFILNAGETITITSGQIHSFQNSANAHGFVLEFTIDFFCKDDSDIELIFQNGLFCHFGMNEVIAVNKAFMEKQLACISEELLNQPYQYLISVHSRIALILVEINREKVMRGDEIWKPDALFLKFLEAVRANFEHNHPLSKFAEMLDTTELKLNELAKLHTGKTALMVVHGLVASEAKRILTYENLTVKETAYKLGFHDPFYFSNFFKKHTHISPKAYQRAHAL